MADNVAVTAGVGTTIAADEAVDATLGTVKFQVVKIADGTLGGTDKLTITTADGALVNLGTNNDVTITGDALTALQLIDNAISGAGFNITQFAGAAVPIGAGVEATAVRVTIATDSTGVLSIDDNGGAITVDGAVTVTNATAANLKCEATIAAAQTIAVTNAGTFAVQESGGALTALQIMDDWDNAASDGASVSGDVAHDTADAGEPVKVGFKATTSLAGLTLVADADRTNGFAGIDGVQVVRTHCNLEDIVSGNASNTDGTSTQCIAAGAAGIKHYITRVTITNTSASNIYVEIKDGATAKHTVPVPANAGATIGFDPPLPGSAATAWNFDPSSAATTIYCSMVGFKSKI